MFGDFISVFLSSTIMWILTTTILLGILTYQSILWQRFKYWKKWNIEQVEPSFPTGNFQDVLLMRKCFSDLLTEMYATTKSDILGFYIFHNPFMLIRAPDIIKQILVSDFSTFHDRTVTSDERADPIGSKVLLTVKNPEWRIMRQKVTPIFTASKIRGMTTHVNKACGDWLNYIDENHLQGPLEAKELCSKLTTEIITSCAFGVEAGSFQNEKAPFQEAGRKIVATTFMNSVRFMCNFLLPSVVRIFRVPFLNPEAIAFLKAAFLQTIGQREAANGPPRGDLIDIIIELKKNKQLSGGITFGFETTSATISFALYELALNTKLQDELRQYVNDLIQTGVKFTYDNMLQLPFLDRIISETLRKYPSLPFLDRRCNKDFTTTSGVTIPKDTAIFIPSMGLHYDEKYYPDPHKFDPDRFLPEEVKERHPCVYLPFGQGPHNCIGERFAMNTVKICLAQLLTKYKVVPCAETPIPIRFSPKAVVLIASEGVPLRFVKL